jgi:hypothetical protein
MKVEDLKQAVNVQPKLGYASLFKVLDVRYRQPMVYSTTAYLLAGLSWVLRNLSSWHEQIMSVQLTIYGTSDRLTEVSLQASTRLPYQPSVPIP